MGSKRYFQLKSMMDYFNDDFDERKYWAYGCNCLILGDRPMSDPGHGLPVDALDSICKAYKDCVKCAKDRVSFRWSDDVDSCGMSHAESEPMLRRKPMSRCDKGILFQWKILIRWTMVRHALENSFNIISVWKTTLFNARITQTAASGHCANVMHNLRVTMLIKKMFLTHNIIYFGRQMTVAKCGTQKITVQGDLAFRIFHRTRSHEINFN